MNSIPWGWQLIVSFTVPIISALDADMKTTQQRSEDERDLKVAEAESYR